MFAYTLRRLLQLVIVLVGVSVIVFVLNRVLPSDPAQMMLGPYATDERIERMHRAMGLDRPVYVQYLTWAGSVLRGDFGTSIESREPVIEEILRRFPATIELTLVSITFAIIVGVSAGVLSAVRRGSLFDASVTVASSFLMSVPVFWLAVMLVFIFGLQLGWLPFSGRLAMGTSIEHITGFNLLDSLLTGNYEGARKTLEHLTLPAIALASFPLAAIARATRSNMLDVIEQDYIRTARSKGLQVTRVYAGHALKNALIPVITVIGLYLGQQLAGAILVEVVFAWPGIGRLGYAAIQARDFPIVQGFILFVTLNFMLINLLVDLLYSVIDPRVQYA